MILDEILAHKKIEVAELKKKAPLDKIQSQAESSPGRKSFLKALSAPGAPLAVIAEIKRRSPSKGLLRQDFNAVAIAREYEGAGAAALSVLTDEKYFGGTAEDLIRVKAAVKIPVLRKDFIVDAYQIYESRAIGADAVLLIAAALSVSQLEEFGSLASRLGMDALYEVHDAADAEKIRTLAPKLVGINNRDLKTFEVDLETTVRMAPLLKNATLVSESGISSHQDLLRVKKCGVSAVLVGESLMKEKNPGQALKKLLGRPDGES